MLSHVQGHPTSLILVPIESTYDFLLVRNSNLGPILHHFGDIAGLLHSRVTPPLFCPNFGGIPVAPDGPCSMLGSASPDALSYSAVKLF